MTEEMQAKIIEFIRDEYLEDEEQELNGSTPIITSGIVDSFSMVSLKNYLEEEYSIKLTDEEASTEAFDSVDRIVALVQKKLES